MRGSGRVESRCKTSCNSRNISCPDLGLSFLEGPCRGLPCGFPVDKASGQGQQPLQRLSHSRRPASFQLSHVPGHEPGAKLRNSVSPSLILPCPCPTTRPTSPESSPATSRNAVHNAQELDASLVPMARPHHTVNRASRRRASTANWLRNWRAVNVRGTWDARSLGPGIGKRHFSMSVSSGMSSAIFWPGSCGGGGHGSAPGTLALLLTHHAGEGEQRFAAGQVEASHQ